MTAPGDAGAEPPELLVVAVEAARLAGALLENRVHGPAQGVGTKSSPTDLVSDADRDSERLIRRFLAQRRPGDGILAEEGESLQSSSGITWIVDPLDGTVNYLFGIPQWAVSVACRDEQGLLCGVVHDPNRSETFRALRGQGATVNERPLSVSNRDSLDRALVGTGFSYDAEIRYEQARVAALLLPKVRDIRRMGSAALDLCAVACGRLDAFYEAPVELWDRSAGELIVREAGGLVSDLPAAKGASTGVVASGPALHEALTNLVAGR